MKKNIIPMSAEGVMYALIEGSGYNPLSAICELIDNAFKDEVSSTFCDVSLKYDETGNPIKIYCADNGLSMDNEELLSFFSIGEKKQNNGNIYSLSKYGIGGKSASLYLGDKLTVFCKRDGFLIKKSIKRGYSEGSSLVVDEYEDCEITEEERSIFNNFVKSEHGSLFVIDELRNGTRKELHKSRINSIKEIIRPLRKTYTELMHKTNKKLFFAGSEILPLRLYGGINKSTKEEFFGDIISNTSIKIDGLNDMRLICVHCPRDVDGNYVYDMPLEKKYSGLHIIRNGRCVTPEGLNGHVYTEDTHHGQGFRAFLYCDGSHDELFGNTFNKTVTTDENFNEILIEKIRPILMKGSNESCRRRREEGSLLVVHANADFDLMIKDMLNKVIKNCKYVKKAKTNINNNHSNNDSNRNKDKERKNRVNKKIDTIGSVTSVRLGVNGKLCEVYLSENQYSVNLNVEHPLYKILKTGDRSGTNILGVILIKLSERISLDESLKEDDKVARRMMKYYDEINESSENILHNLFKDLSYMYEDDDIDEEELEAMASSSIEDSEYCVGTCVSSEDLGITGFNNDTEKKEYLDLEFEMAKKVFS